MIAKGVARRQARDAGHSELTELKVLALHGLLTGSARLNRIPPVVDDRGQPVGRHPLQQNRGIAGHRDTLLLAGGKLPRKMIQPVTEPHAFQDFLRVRFVGPARAEA